MVLAILGEEDNSLAAVANPNKAPVRYLRDEEGYDFAPFEGTDRDEAVLDDDGETLGPGVIKESEDLNSQEKKAELRSHDDAPDDIVCPGVLGNPIDPDGGKAPENEAGEEVINRDEGYSGFDFHTSSPFPNTIAKTPFFVY